MNKKIRLVLVFFVITGFLAGCGTSSQSSEAGKGIEPPHNGVFLVQGNSLVEAFEYQGSPQYVSPDNFPTIQDPQPQFVVWLPQIQLQYFILYNLDNGNEYGYYISDRENGIFDILLEDSLAPGSYCFYQGDPIASPVEIMHWCFSTAANADFGSPPEVEYRQIISSEGMINNENFIEVMDPILGNYIVDNSGMEEGYKSSQVADYIVDAQLFNKWNDSFCTDTAEKIDYLQISLRTIESVGEAHNIFLDRQDNIKKVGVDLIHIRNLGDENFLWDQKQDNPNRCRETFYSELFVRRGFVFVTVYSSYSSDFDEIHSILENIALTIDYLLLGD